MENILPALIAALALVGCNQNTPSTLHQPADPKTLSPIRKAYQCPSLIEEIVEADSIVKMEFNEELVIVSHIYERGRKEQGFLYEISYPDIALCKGYGHDTIHLHFADTLSIIWKGIGTLKLLN